MQTAIIVFMVFATLIGLFSVGLTVADLVKERKGEKASGEKTEPEEKEEQPKKSEEPLSAKEEEKEAPLSELAATVAGMDGQAVVFAKTIGETLEEKYLKLSKDEKRYYDEIVKHAASIEGSKRVKNTRYEEYKLGNSRLVRVLIKRGVIVCEYLMLNENFKKYLDENKVSVKQAPTTLKVTDEVSLQVAKDGIDISNRIIAEEKAYKKELAKMRRRAKKNTEEA